MGRRKKGRPVHGWLVIDKPLGMTSTQVVGKLKRIFDAQKVGHGGTLDPLATGILPVAFGEATKTVSFAMDGRKSYRFSLRWGQATTTDDREGEVIEESPVRPTEPQIHDALQDFVGEIEQIPPRFSAIKVEGQRAYDLARDNQDFELKSRRVQIDRFELVSIDGPDDATFEVDCGKGTYVRSLGRDLALSLGTVAYVTELRRIRVGPFTLEHAISLESLEAMGHIPANGEPLLPVQTALDDIPALALTEAEANRLRHGQSVSLVTRQDLARIGTLSNGDTLLAMAGDVPVAIARFEKGEVSPVRVLNL